MFLHLFHRDAAFFAKTLLQCLDTDDQLLLSKVDTQMIHIVRTLYLFFFTECHSLALFDDSFLTLSQYKNHLICIEVQDLKELEGIEECTQLTELNLSFCECLGVMPGYWSYLNLTPLANLTKLNLMESDIFILEPLRNLVRLTELNLSSNYVSCITDLQLLTNLTKLNLSSQFDGETEIDSFFLQPLIQLGQLTELNVSGFLKTSIVSLSNLTQLKTLVLDRKVDESTLTLLKNTLSLTNVKKHCSWVFDPISI